MVSQKLNNQKDKKVRKNDSDSPMSGFLKRPNKLNVYVMEKQTLMGALNLKIGSCWQVHFKPTLTAYSKSPTM